MLTKKLFGILLMLLTCVSLNSCDIFGPPEVDSIETTINNKKLATSEPSAQIRSLNGDEWIEMTISFASSNAVEFAWLKKWTWEFQPKIGLGTYSGRDLQSPFTGGKVNPWSGDLSLVDRSKTVFSVIITKNTGSRITGTFKGVIEPLYGSNVMAYLSKFDKSLTIEGNFNVKYK
jgi:hypothetical protein